MAKLKPCPFCGGEAYLHKDEEWGDYTVYCLDCKVTLPENEYRNKSAAIKAWNKRS